MSLSAQWVVGVACSAGGLPALRKLLSGLPEDFYAAVVIVQHLSPGRHSQLAELLSDYTRMKVKQVEEGDTLCQGCVFVAKPDFHMVIKERGILHLTSDAKVNFTRPAADPLFWSLAQFYKEKAIGVVLTGAGKDGSAGVQFIKSMGGTNLAQNAETSEHYNMPASAIGTGDVDFILPVQAIAVKLLELVKAQ